MVGFYPMYLQQPSTCRYVESVLMVKSTAADCFTLLLCSARQSQAEEVSRYSTLAISWLELTIDLVIRSGR